MEVVEYGARRHRRELDHFSAALDQRLAPRASSRLGVDQHGPRDLEQPRRGPTRSRRSSTTRVLVAFAQPTRRSSDGSSASTVPLPTSKASCSSRRPSAQRRPAGDEIQRLSPHRGRDLAVEAHRPLERDLGSTQQLRDHEAQVELDRLAIEHAPLHLDSALAQPAEALTSGARVGIDVGGDHARDAGGEHRVDARRRAAMMRARLECHVQRAASRLLPCLAQRDRLGVRFAGAR